MLLFIRHVFRPIYEVFVAKKLRKLGTLEKLESMMKKDCFFEKKSFQIFESILHKNGKAQNMPLLTDRAVFFPAEPRCVKFAL